MKRKSSTYFIQMGYFLFFFFTKIGNIKPKCFFYVFFGRRVYIFEMFEAACNLADMRTCTISHVIEKISALRGFCLDTLPQLE